MKTIMTFILSLIASTTFANTSAGFEVATVQGINQNISSISVMNTGALLVTSTKNQVKSFKLSQENDSKLKYLISSIESAQLMISKRVVVCMMMPNPMFRQELTVLEPNSNKMRLILSPDNCSEMQVTSPKNKYEFQMALELRQTMIALANQIARF